MPEFRLTHAAEEDLIGIAHYGDEQFGEAQSNRHRDQLKQHFARLAQTPRLYPAVDHIRTGYRRSVLGAHAIYYRIQPNGVLIVRILGRQDANGALAEDANPRQ